LNVSFCCYVRSNGSRGARKIPNDLFRCHFPLKGRRQIESAFREFGRNFGVALAQTPYENHCPFLEFPLISDCELRWKSISGIVSQELREAITER
jgi:hypothetical protein